LIFSTAATIGLSYLCFRRNLVSEN